MTAGAPVVLKPDAGGLDEAIALLAAGEIVAAPTDTVYGIAARLERPRALQHLFLAKGRPEAKAIPILLSDADIVSMLSSDPMALMAFAETFWPGALTVVTSARPGLPSEVITLGDEGQETIALRLPDNDIMRTLCRRSGGALAVTSANTSGEAPATSAAAILDSRLPHLAAIVDGGDTPGPLPSTIVSVAGPDLCVIREGVIPVESVTAVWRDVHERSEMRGMISQ